MNSAVAILRKYFDRVTPEQRFNPEIKLHTDNNLFVQYKAPKLLIEGKDFFITAIGEGREEMIKNLPAPFLKDYAHRVATMKQIARQQHNIKKGVNPEKMAQIQAAIDKLKEEDTKLISIFNDFGILRRRFKKQGDEIYQKELLKFVRAHPFFYSARRDYMFVSLKRGNIDVVCDNLELFYRTSQDLKTTLLFVDAALKGAKEKKIVVTPKNRKFFKNFIERVKKSRTLSPEERIKINQIEQIL